MKFWMNKECILFFTHFIVKISLARQYGLYMVKETA